MHRWKVNCLHPWVTPDAQICDLNTHEEKERNQRDKEYLSLILARRIHVMFHKSYIFANPIKVIEYIL